MGGREGEEKEARDTLLRFLPLPAELESSKYVCV